MKIRSLIPVSYSADNLFKKGFVEIETKMLQKNENDVVFEVSDYFVIPVVGEVNGEEITHYERQKNIRYKKYTVASADYEALFNYADGLIQGDLSLLEKERTRENIAFEYFFKNDFLRDENDNLTQFLLYHTLPENWELII
jgi:hypothetical protein